MSKNINVNPDQYKVAGRERQGENIIHDAEKHARTTLKDRRRTGPKPPAPKRQPSR